MPFPARVLSAATALPAHRVAQAEVKAVAGRLFGSDHRLRALLPVFDTCGVERRWFVQPLERYLEPARFGARNDAFIAAAAELSETCLDRALARAGLGRGDIDHLIFATTTGVSTPSIDALLLHRMGLRADLERTPLFGVGCAAGGVGLARAADLARARPGAVIALLTAELCSLTFQVDALTPENIVGAALFGDGAAAALLVAEEGPGPWVAAQRSHTFPDSLDVMGWRVDEQGLGLILSKELPALVEREAAGIIAGFLDDQGLKSRDLAHFLVHPGGPKVIDAMERAMGVPAGSLDRTRAFLREHGNLSSASVLFLLDELLQAGRAEPGDRGLLVSFGPGFSAQLLLLEW